MEIRPDAPGQQQQERVNSSMPSLPGLLRPSSCETNPNHHRNASNPESESTEGELMVNTSNSTMNHAPTLKEADAKPREEMDNPPTLAPKSKCEPTSPKHVTFSHVEPDGKKPQQINDEDKSNKFFKSVSTALKQRRIKRRLFRKNRKECVPVQDVDRQIQEWNDQGQAFFQQHSYDPKPQLDQLLQTCKMEDLCENMVLDDVELGSILKSVKTGHILGKVVNKNVWKTSIVFVDREGNHRSLPSKAFKYDQQSTFELKYLRKMDKPENDQESEQENQIKQILPTSLAGFMVFVQMYTDICCEMGKSNQEYNPKFVQSQLQSTIFAPVDAFTHILSNSPLEKLTLQAYKEGRAETIQQDKDDVTCSETDSQRSFECDDVFPEEIRVTANPPLINDSMLASQEEPSNQSLSGKDDPASHDDNPTISEVCRDLNAASDIHVLSATPNLEIPVNTTDSVSVPPTNDSKESADLTANKQLSTLTGVVTVNRLSIKELQRQLQQLFNDVSQSDEYMGYEKEQRVQQIRDQLLDLEQRQQFQQSLLQEIQKESAQHMYYNR